MLLVLGQVIVPSIAQTQEEKNFAQCALENNPCNTPGGNYEISWGSDGRYHLVCHGTDNRWIHSYVAGRFPCRLNNGYEIDPAPGVATRCEYAHASWTAPTGADWSDCGGEGASWLPTTGAGRYLVRFGVGGSGANREHIYRVLDGDSLDCSRSALWQFRSTVHGRCSPGEKAGCSSTAKTQILYCTTPGDQPTLAWSGNH